MAHNICIHMCMYMNNYMHNTFIVCGAYKCMWRIHTYMNMHMCIADQW